MSNLVFPSLSEAESGFSFLDLVPDTNAWIKDPRGCFVYGNRLFFERFGFSSMQALIGRCDYDIAPDYLAARYIGDDALVLKGGMVNDRLELILGPDGRGDWFLTSKWPITDPARRILGTFGLSRHLNRAEGRTIPFRELRAPVDYITRHFAGPISVQALASACSTSVSALERRFRRHLGKTPRQYINEVRLDNARRMLLDTDKAIGTIAVETGFADHSHFTRRFTRYFGLTPRQVRAGAATANKRQLQTPV